MTTEAPSDDPTLAAFWLYPDWDGPLKEPFWMRPPRLPDVVGVQVMQQVDGTYRAWVEFGTNSVEERRFLRPGIIPGDQDALDRALAKFT
jgi:hypothetical protein